MEAETYHVLEEMHDNGMFFYTDCGNRMYSVNNDPMFYHGKLCPRCFWEGKMVTLYIRGSDEANKIMEERRKNDEL